ncbi:hypothetical protein BKA62DRAFT_807350 [Auriculariales sp. MPI-PUGE-AT-0066]|nr:hypothetical protein BKA62DRAFT_807350 [Auriculariales sp. MPI-PUGE-AT-0066]
MHFTTPYKDTQREELAHTEATLTEWREKQTQESEEVVSLTARIQQLHGHLRVHTQLLSTASSMVKTLEFVVSQQRAELFPVMAIPDDVLSFIFQAVRTYIPDVDADPAAPTVNYHMNGSVAVAHIAAVSRKWRAVALRTPSIWSTINIPPLNQPRVRLAKSSAVSWVEERVSRTGSAPLRISFLCIGRPDDKVYASILRVLAKRTSQWQHLAAVCHQPFPELWKYLIGPLPALESIVLSASSQENPQRWDPWSHWPSTADDKPRYLSLAPNLRNVSIFSVPPLWLSNGRTPAGWASVQYFDLAYDVCSIEYLWDILAGMSGLRFLRLKSSQPRILSAPLSTVHGFVELPHLTRLSLVGPFAAWQLVRTDTAVLLAPVLSTLILESCVHSVPHLDVLFRSWPSIEAIEIHGSNLATMPDIVPALRCAFGVRRVVFNASGISGDLLRALADPHDVMWPVLEHMELLGGHVLGTGGPRLAELIRVRTGIELEHKMVSAWTKLKSILINEVSHVEECDRRAFGLLRSWTDCSSAMYEVVRMQIHLSRRDPDVKPDFFCNVGAYQLFWIGYLLCQI